MAEYHSCLRVACLVPDYPAQAHKDDLLFRVGKVWVVRGEGAHRTQQGKVSKKARHKTATQCNVVRRDATRRLLGCVGRTG